LEFDIEELRSRYQLERERRVRPDGNAQYVPARNAFAHFAEDPWANKDTSREPIRAHSEVLVLGGGWGGLLVGARLAERGVRDVRIIDVAGDFGGTWYWNRYPGAMCDIEAHIYLPLLEELAYLPKHRYSYGPELLEHAQRIGREYDLYRLALFQTRIESAEWNADRQVWQIHTDQGDELTANFFVLAGGRQSTPKLPSVPGLDTYSGHIFHSSRWDYSYTGGGPHGELFGLRDRNVGVVGTGATALQIVPAIAPYARELFVFQRTPSTVGLRDNYPTGRDHVKDQGPGWQRRRRTNFQQLCQFFSTGQDDRPSNDEVGDSWTELFSRLVSVDLPGAERALGRELSPSEVTYLQEVADFRVMNELRARIDEVVSDASTADLLKPWYRWQCKRPGFHDEYLRTFNQPNVTLVDTRGGGVERFTPHGVVVAGAEYGIDCVVMATGFEAMMPYTDLIGFDPVGADGLTLSSHWADGMRTYLGMVTDRFPNLFLVGSNPQTAAAVNAVHLLDEQATHVAHILTSMRERSLRTIVASSEGVDNYVAMITGDPRNEKLLAFYLECTPGYYNSEGKARDSQQLFLGARFPDGPIAYYKHLAWWRENGNFRDMMVA